MAKEFTIQSVIVCDDIRKEMSGKDILIGVYSGVIQFPSLPSMITNLAIRIELKTNLKEIEDATIELQSPMGEKLFSMGGRLQVTDPENPMSLNVSSGTIEFKTTGIYKVLFGKKDRMEAIYTFKIMADTQPANVN